MAKSEDKEKTAKSVQTALESSNRVKNKKIREELKKREDIVARQELVQTVAHTLAEAYREVFPGSEGFIEFRVKSKESIKTKVDNKIKEIIQNKAKKNEKNQPEQENKEEQENQADSGNKEEQENSEDQESPEDQKKIKEAINALDIKDILAFTVITTEPPRLFKIGDGEAYRKFQKIVGEMETSKLRLEEHSRFIDTNDKKVRSLRGQIEELKAELSQAKESEKKQEEIEELKKQLQQAKKGEELSFLAEKLIELNSEQTKEELTQIIKQKSEEYIELESAVEYGEKNYERTEETYSRELRELQYEMSSYFVNHLKDILSYKFDEIESIKEPKKIQKPNFRAINTGYAIKTLPGKKGFTLKFEAQGKGKLDYDDGEFTAEGAMYHDIQQQENMKVPKNTNLLESGVMNFALIEAKDVKDIEESVRRKYKDIVDIEDFTENLNDDELKAEYSELKAYEEKVKEQVTEEFGDTHLARRELRTKMQEAITSAREHLIQNEIERRIDREVDKFADSPKTIEQIKSKEKLKEVYEQAKDDIKKDSKPKKSKEEIEHEARVRVLYYAKEQEILQLANEIIPTYSRANIPNNPDEEIVVYTFTPGESIYRYLYNRLNGLKDEHGKYVIEPQEQQKRALFKLAGLFQTDDANFLTYDRNAEKFSNEIELDR